ncbi:hypothetical protein QUB80_31965 [Chlorogloeopsis sp. ULAP01]|uniref:hypothetical protein n=1 Tax=Chlorogloeopsis sp. ULAP01 TaxID=3056483 RepID=UPI0025AA4C24|nr:hypothetical protein [Chlorogloeopsis sp. ULAP01]MDM9385273.1 hypothetical protein [Chlorogloeopsis sp. ULAP01]
MALPGGSVAIKSPKDDGEARSFKGHSEPSSVVLGQGAKGIHALANAQFPIPDAREIPQTSVGG